MTPRRPQIHSKALLTSTTRLSRSNTALNRQIIRLLLERWFCGHHTMVYEQNETNWNVLDTKLEADEAYIKRKALHPPPGFLCFFANTDAPGKLLLTSGDGPYKKQRFEDWKPSSDEESAL
jgi:hypothetical protein